MDPAWRRVVGQEVEPKYLRAYLERGRGHSKSTDLGAAATWALFASRRKLSGVCCATDKDQAAIIRDAISTLLRLNPWLSQVLKVQASRVRHAVLFQMICHTGGAIDNAYLFS